MYRRLRQATLASNLYRSWVLFASIGIFLTAANSWAVLVISPPLQSFQTPQVQSATKKVYIRSNIDFRIDGFIDIKFADIGATDPILSCPLDDMPTALKAAVTQLKLKVTESVSKIKDARGDRCSALQNDLKSTTSQMGFALQNQFMMMNGTTSATNQALINSQIRQANAINSVISTTTDMVVFQCIQSMDDKLAIQKLLGQMVMISGLFMGGWQGIALAAGGQLLANLPIFHDEIDQSLKVLQQFDELNQRGSFLCLFRQMLKMSVLLFANEDEQIIHGLDMSFESGPVKTTVESIEKFKREAPESFADATLINDITRNSSHIFAELETWEGQQDNPIPVFNSVQLWCENNHKILGARSPSFQSSLPLQAYFLHPQEQRDKLVASIQYLQNTCAEFNKLGWGVLSRADLTPQLNNYYWHLKTIRDYHRILQDVEDLELATILKTVVSMQYFDVLKKSMKDYQSEKGNQARLNYRRLTNKLASELGNKSFSQLIKTNYQTLTKHEFFHKDPVHSLQIKKRALWAMLDLCQTMDPTLTRLFIDRPADSKLLQRWKKSCAGPKSKTCRAVINAPEQAMLLSTDGYREYFNSLCATEVQPDFTSR